MATLQWFFLHARCGTKKKTKCWPRAHLKIWTSWHIAFPCVQWHKSCRGHRDTREQYVSEVETEHWLRTGYRRFNQGLAFSVPVLSIDTNHILHCGLQTFNGHLRLIWKGRSSNCRSTEPPKPLLGAQWKAHAEPIVFICRIIMKHPFHSGKSVYLFPPWKTCSLVTKLGQGGEQVLFGRMLFPWTEQQHSKLYVYSTST